MSTPQAVVITSASTGVVGTMARAFAADHPKRKQYWVEFSTFEAFFGNKLIAPILDRYMAKTAYGAQQTSPSASLDRTNNLREPLDGADAHDFGAHGIFDDESLHRAPQMWFSHRVRLVIVAAIAGARVGVLTAKALRS